MIFVQNLEPQRVGGKIFRTKELRAESLCEYVVKELLDYYSDYRIGVGGVVNDQDHNWSGGSAPSN